MSRGGGNWAVGGVDGCAECMRNGGGGSNRAVGGTVDNMCENLAKSCRSLSLCRCVIISMLKMNVLILSYFLLDAGEVTQDRMMLRECKSPSCHLFDE